jgi:hypothetical protein
VPRSLLLRCDQHVVSESLPQRGARDRPLDVGTIYAVRLRMYS